MKHTIVILVTCILLFSACNSEKRQIEKNAHKYLTATGNYNIEEAIPYASSVTREVTLPFFKNTLLPKTDTAYILANQPATIVIDSVRILCEDTAKVAYTKTTPIKVMHNTIYMVKEDGVWLAYAPLAIPFNNKKKIAEEGNKESVQ